jgi:Xaa-Pro aminopeptidase
MAKKLTSAVLIVQGGSNDALLRYLSGFSAPDPVVLLVAGKRRELVVSLLECGRARAAEQVTRVWTPQELPLAAGERPQLGYWALALLRQHRIRQVDVPADFPVAIADLLRQHRIRVQAAGDLYRDQRRRKRTDEIQMIRQAQRAAVGAMRAAMALLGRATPDQRGYACVDGRRVRSEMVQSLIQKTLLEYQTSSDQVIVAGGRQGADPHERGHGLLPAGYPIVIDIFPRHQQTGYWGDLTRTLVVGQPLPQVRRMWKAVRAAQQAALAEVRAGVTVRRVHQAAQKTLVAHGFETTVRNGWGEGFIHSTGHGIGLDIHEAPSINLSNTRLRSGDVITVEPGLYYKEWGGVRIEDTVAVTRTGYDLLARCPYGS